MGLHWDTQAAGWAPPMARHDLHSFVNFAVQLDKLQQFFYYTGQSITIDFYSLMNFISILLQNQHKGEKSQIIAHNYGKSSSLTKALYLGLKFSKAPSYCYYCTILLVLFFPLANVFVENKLLASLTICCVENQAVMSYCSCFSSHEGNMNTQLWLSGLKEKLLNKTILSVFVQGTCRHQPWSLSTEFSSWNQASRSFVFQESQGHIN